MLDICLFSLRKIYDPFLYDIVLFIIGGKKDVTTPTPPSVSKPQTPSASTPKQPQQQKHQQKSGKDKKSPGNVMFLPQ
jgi:hypothetical protein